MNKYVIGLIGILLVLLSIFFFLWRGERSANIELTNKLDIAQNQIIMLNDYNKNKEEEIKKIQQKYNIIVSSYEGNNCENQKVSIEMIEALKNIRDNND